MKFKCRAFGVSIAFLAFSTGLSSPAYSELILGFSTAKTGPYVSLASTNEIAADIAVEEINANGGVNGENLRLIKFDTGGDPRQAALAVRRFAEDEGALAIVGPFSSSEVRVAFPAGERAGITQMSMSSSAPGLTEGFSYGFRNNLDEVKVINTVLDVLKELNTEMDNAAIIFATDDTVSKAIGSAILPVVFEDYGIEVVGSIDFQHNAFDLSPQISRLKELDADLIGVGAPPEGAINLAKEAQRQELQAKIIGGATFADPDLPARMHPAGKGVTVGTTFYADMNDRTKKFAAEFSKRAKERGLQRTEPNQMDAATYDIVYLYAQAMKDANVQSAHAIKDSRAGIRDALVDMEAFDGLSGSQSFDENRDALKPVYVLEADQGVWKLLGSRETH